MSALTSLLVRDGVVPVRKIEDALQRQVISGGDVETILLEMDAVPENVLAAYRAALHGLAPATREEVMAVPAGVVRLVPPEVAFEHRLIPLAVHGGVLEVAVRDPLGAEQGERLGFLLGYEIVCRIACEVRVAAGLAHHFGSELPPRFVRLLDRLRKRDPGVAPVVGSGAHSRIAAHASEIPYKQPAADPGQRFEGRTQPIAPLIDDGQRRARRTTARGLGVVSEDPELAEAAEREREARRTRSEPRREPVASIPDDEDEAIDEGPVIFPSARKAEPPPARTPRRTTSHSGLRLVRGPLTLAAGERLLKRASDRDQILEIFFSFARQFFDYTALFVVQDDAADGREAWGVGASTEELAAVAIPLERPSVFAEARRSLAPLVRRLSGTETDREIASAMRRANAPSALVMPIAIRQRVVLLLYGDRDGEEFDLGAVMELVRFGARVVEAFELLILRKKRVGYHTPSEIPAARGSLKQAAKTVAETAGTARPDLERRRAESGAWRPGRRASVEIAPAPADDDSWSTISADAPVAAAEPERSEDAPVAAPVELVAPTHPPDAPPQAILGIPRVAPPPPPADELDLGGIEIEAAEEEAEEEPELIVDAAESDGDDELEDIEEPPPERPRPRVQGTYRVHGGPVDVVRATGDAPRRTSGRAPRPPRDPRREDDDDSEPAPEVVRTREGAVRPPPRGLDAETRSVIVDMGEQVHAQVEDLLSEADDARRNELIVGLLYLGEAALPALVQAFPGPVAYDRHRSNGAPPAGRDVSIVARALVAFGERAVPYVASLLGSASADVRYYAALVASELVHPDLTESVAERIYDPDPDVRRLACALLPRFAGYRAFDEVRVVIRRTARLRGKDPARRWYAVAALASLRDVEVIGKLIELLKEDDSELVDYVQRALIVLTCADHGRSHRRWSAWYEKHRGQHRVEWLIEGLLHHDERIRALAGAELERLTQESYGYHAGSPKRDRERVHRRYREWWTGEGQRRFA